MNMYLWLYFLAMLIVSFGWSYISVTYNLEKRPFLYIIFFFTAIPAGSALCVKFLSLWVESLK